MSDLFKLEVVSLLSARTYEGVVQLRVNDATVQMDLDKTREVIAMLQTALEAAISDQFVFAFLRERTLLSVEEAAAALSDFREYRQGSRTTVTPQ